MSIRRPAGRGTDHAPAMTASASTYTPRTGSKAEAALAALARAGWLSVGDLAAEIDVERDRVHSFVAVPMQHGVIVLQKRAGVAGFSLADAGGHEPAAHPPVERRAAAAAVTARAPRTRATPAVITPPGSVAITDDGSVLVIDGDRVVARLSAQQARNIAALAARFPPQ